MKWLKGSWAWVSGLLIAFGLVLAATKASRHRRRADRLEQLAAGEIENMIEANTDEARAAADKAAEHRRRATESKEKAQSRLDQLGSRDETLGDIADSWNRSRLRNNTNS